VLIGLRDIRLLAAMMNGKTSIADELVFPSRVGTVLKPDNIAPRYMEPTLEKAGLRHFRFHDLRQHADFLIMPTLAGKQQFGGARIESGVGIIRSEVF